MAKKSKSKRNEGAVSYKGFFQFPRAMLAMDDFISLSSRSLKLLVDIGSQYNGYNNGDLCCSMSLMRKRGWNSNDLLTKSKKELIEKRWIERTRSGGFNMGPDLYAITWQPIDACGGKLDVSATRRPSRHLERPK